MSHAEGQELRDNVKGRAVTVSRSTTNDRVGTISRVPEVSAYRRA